MEPQLIHQGKVRDVYRWEENLLLVATDRISAFDVILPTPILDKGIILTQLSRFWFEKLQDSIAHHVLSFDLPKGLNRPEWKNRVTYCKRAEVVPLECVVRGYLAGYGWKDYQKTGTVQGYRIPSGLREAERLPEPLFTPSTKAPMGHDEPLDEAGARKHVEDDVYDQLRDFSLKIYSMAHEYALSRGIILADTKFEFGWIDGKICLVDEVLTPDSSRFWPLADYQPGASPVSYDKQFVRNYLLSLKGWDQKPPGPELPQDVVDRTREKYLEAYTQLAGKALSL